MLVSGGQEIVLPHDFPKQDWAILAFFLFSFFFGGLFTKIEKSHLKIAFFTRRVLFLGSGGLSHTSGRKSATAPTFQWVRGVDPLLRWAGK